VHAWRGRPRTTWMDNIKMRTEINGESTSTVRPTIGPRTAKEQNRTVAGAGSARTSYRSISSVGVALNIQQQMRVASCREQRDKVLQSLVSFLKVKLYVIGVAYTSLRRLSVIVSWWKVHWIIMV